MRNAMARWLSPANHDETGKQKQKLAELLPKNLNRGIYQKFAMEKFNKITMAQFLCSLVAVTDILASQG